MWFMILRIIFQHLVYFSNGKNKPIKGTEQFISPINNLCVNVLFNMLSMQFSDQRVLLLLSMMLLSKKLFQKNILYLTNTCVNRTFWKNCAAFKVSLKVYRWVRKFP